MVDQHATVASTTDEERAIATLTMAFADDAVTRWVLREPQLYLAYWPRLIKAFAGEAFAGGTADTIDDHGGIALWLAPGVSSDDETMGALAVEAIPEEQQEEIFTFMAQMAEFHPQEPHWYLPLIGVDPARHRKGFGAALLQDTLRRCDQDHVAAYLESTNPANITLYQRHGFELRGTIQVGSAPPLFPMLRPAR
jgi:ribosomal protein S18 acetylase RimI-like enzyme